MTWSRKRISVLMDLTAEGSAINGGRMRTGNAWWAGSSRTQPSQGVEELEMSRGRLRRDLRAK